jgi:hypothetical protein
LNFYELIFNLIVIKINIMAKTSTSKPSIPKPNPNYPSKTGKPSGSGRGNEPKQKVSNLKKSR